MSLFAKTTALITGASRGLGESFALALAERGCTPILTARTPADLVRVAEVVRARTGVTAPTVIADAGAAAGVKHLTDAVAKLGWPVDILINNAGFGSGGRFHELDIEREIAMVQLNVETCMRLARHYLPGMLARGAGGIINVASLGGFMPMPFMATYGATKAFLLSFSEALWAETRGTGVRVLALCPGPVPTGFGTAAGLPPTSDRAAVQTAPDVVEAALRAFEQDKSFVVPGGLARLTSIMPRLLPRSLVAGLAAKNIGGRVLGPRAESEPPPM